MTRKCEGVRWGHKEERERDSGHKGNEGTSGGFGEKGRRTE